MIAYNLYGGEEPQPQTARAGSRAGQTAAQLRRARTARSRHRTLVMGLGGLAIATLVVLSYLWLMSNTYQLNYQIQALDNKRTTLAEESARLDDTIAQLESRERLAALADSLGMRDPRRFALVTVPPAQPVERPRGLAFLPIATNWLR
jgi:cell division protein FtsL